MYEASENLEFEKAAKLRDRINAIEKMKDGQDIFSDKTYDFDVVALAQNVELASIAVMCYRGGRIPRSDAVRFSGRILQRKDRCDSETDLYRQGNGGQCNPRRILLCSLRT